MQATLLCTALLIPVLACYPAEADEVTLKKKDGTAVTGEYLGTVRDGQSVFVQLQVNAQVERHPLADFTASAKKTIVRLNRLAKAMEEKSAADAAAEKAKAQAAEKAAERARQDKLFTQAFPAEILTHNERIMDELRANGDLDSSKRQDAANALLTVVCAYSMPEGDILGEKTTLGEFVRSIDPSQVNGINELLDAGLDQALVKVDGKQQTWREVWSKRQNYNLDPQHDLFNVPSELSLLTYMLLEGPPLQTPLEIAEQNQEIVKQLEQEGLGGDENERPIRDDAIARLGLIVSAYCNERMGKGLITPEHILRCSTPRQLEAINDVVNAGAGELLVQLPEQQERQTFREIWLECKKLKGSDNSPAKKRYVRLYGTEAIHQKIFPPEVAKQNSRIGWRVLVPGDTPAAHLKLRLCIAAYASRGLNRDGAEQEGALFSTELEDVLRSLTAAEIKTIDELLDAGLAKSLVKVQGQEQQTWGEVWRKCLEIKSQLPEPM